MTQWENRRSEHHPDRKRRHHHRRRRPTRLQPRLSPAGGRPHRRGGRGRGPDRSCAPAATEVIDATPDGRDARHGQRAHPPVPDLHPRPGRRQAAAGMAEGGDLAGGPGAHRGGCLPGGAAWAWWRTSGAARPASSTTSTSTRSRATTMACSARPRRPAFASCNARGWADMDYHPAFMETPDRIVAEMDALARPVARRGRRPAAPGVWSADPLGLLRCDDAAHPGAGRGVGRGHAHPRG